MRTHRVAATWEAAMGLLALTLDRAAQLLASVVHPAANKGCGAGVFFWSHQKPFWDAWAEPGAFNLRLGRLEIQVDRPH